MSLDDRTAQQHLTPEARRALLRAFADRMLLKVTAMDDPEDMPGIECAVRLAAVIERLYSRCDRAESHAPDPRKAAAERATHEEAAIKARVSLANTMKWGSERRHDLGQWWEAAQKATETPAATASGETVIMPPGTAKVTCTDLTNDIEAARAELALRKRAVSQSAHIPTPPLFPSPS
jgi:hypothetical protein